MNIPEKLNAAIQYIEENLCGEIDLGEIARIACVTQDSFMRFFSYMTGMTLKEYVRCRKLSNAAEELQRSDGRVIDLAIKYGYESADSFARAFARQHGITPSAAKKGAMIKVFPPASFHIMIKGAKEMNFRLIEIEGKTIYGISREFDREKYSTREALRHVMWSDDCDAIPAQLCEGTWNQPGSHAYDGEWYGLWRDGRYMIARERKNVKEGTFEQQTITAGKYAAFTTEKGVVAWEALPELRSLIFDSWLPGSGYQLRSGDMIEVFHLQTDKAERQKNRYYEIWIPIQ